MLDTNEKREVFDDDFQRQMVEVIFKDSIPCMKVAHYKSHSSQVNLLFQYNLLLSQELHTRSQSESLQEKV